MVSDHDLRAALALRADRLDPDVEAELDALLVRALRRRVTRTAAYVVGVVAAVTLAVLLVGHSWRATKGPEPVDDDTPVRTLIPARGVYGNPKAIEPGPWRVRFLHATGAMTHLEVDVPEGWGQDDDVALSTGSDADTSTRRLELSADLTGIYRGPCRSRTDPAPGTALEQAQAIAALPGVRAGPVERAVLDGHPGYQVRIQLPTELRGRGGCADGMAMLFRTPDWATYVPLGWTCLVRIVDVGGHALVASAIYGPGATAADVNALVEMVDTATLSPG